MCRRAPSLTWLDAAVELDDREIGIVGFDEAAAEAHQGIAVGWIVRQRRSELALGLAVTSCLDQGDAAFEVAGRRSGLERDQAVATRETALTSPMRRRMMAWRRWAGAEAGSSERALAQAASAASRSGVKLSTWASAARLLAQEGLIATARLAAVTACA